MKTFKYIFTFALLTLLGIANTSRSQYTQQWNATYESGQNDMINNSAMDAAGNIYVTGGSSTAASGQDIVTIKYNSAGVQQWMARYTSAGIGADEGSVLTVDNGGNVYVAGKISPGSDIVVIKYNPIGTQQWTCVFAGTGSGQDVAAGIRVDNSGNVFVGGHTYSGDPTTMDLVAIKINPMGSIEWASKYDANVSSTEEAYGMELDASGNIYICGQGYITTSTDMLLVKWNSVGVIQWAKNYGGTASATDVSRAMALDAAGNIYITGSCNNTGSAQDITTVKFNPSGVQQWTASFNGTGNLLDNGFDIAVDAAGNSYIAGITYTSAMPDSGNMIVIKYNASGVQQWASMYNGTGNMDDIARSVAVDNTGNVYIGGQSKGIGTAEDFALIKYNSIGVQQWVSRTNGAGNSTDIVKKIFVDSQYGIYAAGTLTSAGNNYDYYTVKYSALSGIQLNGETPSSFSLSQNYPNPFNPSTNFEFKIAASGYVSLKVYDIQGKEVKSILNEDLKAGSYSYKFDGTGLNSGVYFYTLQASEFVETKKMLLIK